MPPTPEGADIVDEPAPPTDTDLRSGLMNIFH